jgi:hypothetical protein
MNESNLDRKQNSVVTSSYSFDKSKKIPVRFLSLHLWPFKHFKESRESLFQLIVPLWNHFEFVLEGFVRVWNLVAAIEGGTQAKGVWE